MMAGHVAQRAELVKWVGLVAMFVDHAWRFLGVGFVGSGVVGRYAFPCFAVALAAQVSDPLRVGLRLVLVGAALGVALVFFGRWPVLDVLCTLGAGLVLAWLGSRVVPWSWLAAVPVLLFATRCEYGIPGAVLVCALWVLLRSDQPLFGAALALGASCFLVVRGNGVGFVVGLGLALCLVVVGPVVPRVRKFFLSAYVLQWPVIWGLRALT